MQKKKGLTSAQLAVLTGIGGVWLILMLAFGGYLIYSNSEPAMAPIPLPAPSRTSIRVPQSTFTNQVINTQTPQVISSPTVKAVSSINGCPPVDAPRQIGLVLEILDGGKLKVKIDGVDATVGYLGVLVPQSGDYAEKSKQKISEMIQGKIITILSGPTDKGQDGSLLRYVYSGDTFVNLELLKQGYGVWERNDLLDSACKTVFMAAAQSAIDSTAGMFLDYATSESKFQATSMAAQPTQVVVVANTQSPGGNPGSASEDICSNSNVQYAKEVHRINLDYLEKTYGIWRDYYQGIIDQAMRDRDASRLTQAQRDLEKLTNDYNSAVGSENESYKNSVPAKCR